MKITVPMPDGCQRGQRGVYVLLDGHGDVLYIGRTMDLARRLRAHSQQPWWSDLRQIEWTPCVDGVEARLVERQMIETFVPDANTNDRLPVISGRHVLPEHACESLRALRAGAIEAGFGSSPANLRFHAYVKALRSVGWTLSSIGYPLGVTREYVRQLVKVGASDAVDIPAVPAVPVRVKPPGKRALLPHLSGATVAEMQSLQTNARRCNGGTPAGAPERVASVQLTELIAEQVIRGVIVTEIARALGVTPYAVRSRLARHGYTRAAPSVDGVRYLGRPNQTRAGHADTCARGHDLTRSNLRITSPGGVRVCRACERIRCDAYRARRRQDVAS